LRLPGDDGKVLTVAQHLKDDVDLSEAIDFAMQPRHPAPPRHHLFDFPEHPDEGRTQANHDDQEHQRQFWRCGHISHPPDPTRTTQQQ
jgi:hypothetical protein